jgi:hypothetical protein
MIKIASESELLRTFRAVDRDQVQLPPDFKFPLAVKNFTTWLEPSGHRVYLVYEDTKKGGPIGIVFQRTHGSPDAAPAMCQWCNSVRGGSGVSLLTAAVGSNRRVGIHLCSDLQCADEEMVIPGVNDLRESLSRTEKVLRLMQRMSDFAIRNLF